MLPSSYSVHDSRFISSSIFSGLKELNPISSKKKNLCIQNVLIVFLVNMSKMVIVLILTNIIMLYFRNIEGSILLEMLVI